MYTRLKISFPQVNTVVKPTFVYTQTSQSRQLFSKNGAAAQRGGALSDALPVWSCDESNNMNIYDNKMKWTTA